MFNDFTLIINFVLYFQNEAAYTAVWRWGVWGGGGGDGESKGLRAYYGSRFFLKTIFRRK